MRYFSLFLFSVMFSVSLFGIEQKEITSIANEILSKWYFRGMAVVIIDGDNFEFIKGYGFDKNSDRIIDDQTFFEIGSLTKSFTSYGALLLQKEGKLNLDQPIKKCDSSFELNEKRATEICTLRDLLSHRSGLPGTAEDSWRLWWHTGRTREDLIIRLKHVPLKYASRAQFAYNSMGYVIAAEAMSKIAGVSWKDYLQKSILDPIGIYDMKWMDWNAMNPAMGMICNARDMTKWLKFCINQSEEFKEAFKQESEMTPAGFLSAQDQMFWPLLFHDARDVGYGMGWMNYKIGKHQIYMHSGLTDAMQSMMAICPEKKIGIVILTNNTSHPGAACFINMMLDRLLNLPRKDWLHLADGLMQERTKWMRGNDERLNKIKDLFAPPETSFYKYEGIYSNPAYGKIRIMKNLNIETFNHQNGSLHPWKKNNFVINGYGEVSTLITFEQVDGKITSCSLPFLPPFVKE